MTNIYKRIVTYFRPYSDSWTRKEFYFSSRQKALDFDVSKSEFLRTHEWTAITAPIEATALPDHFTIRPLDMIA